MIYADDAFKDVTKYPKNLLNAGEHGISLPLTYRKVWDDGFGARGWKLNATIGDPEIIASTRETGEKINTSVLIHDMLDHFVSGFGVSGHRSEAMALSQLSMRTGSNPGPDYEQMIKEDITCGRVNGETLASFLPREMLSILPSHLDMSDREVISYIKEVLGEVNLNEQLLEYFKDLGRSGNEHATTSWKKLGLDQSRVTELGLALQDLLDIVDTYVEESGWVYIEADVLINNETCSFNLKSNSRGSTELVFQTTVVNRIVNLQEV